MLVVLCRRVRVLHWCLWVICWVFFSLVHTEEKLYSTHQRNWCSVNTAVQMFVGILPPIDAWNHSSVSLHVRHRSPVVYGFSPLDQETITADDVLQDPAPQMPSTNSKEALDKDR